MPATIPNLNQDTETLGKNEKKEISIHDYEERAHP